LARRGERRVCTRGSPAYARSRDAGGRFGVLTEQRAHKRYRTSTGVLCRAKAQRARALAMAQLRCGTTARNPRTRRGRKEEETSSGRCLTNAWCCRDMRASEIGGAAVEFRWRRHGSTELALGDSRARGADVVEGERDGGPRPEAERRCRLVVVEALRNAGYTAAQRPCSDAEDRGMWC